MEITSPDKFAVWFDNKYQGAYRKMNTEDVRDMTTCGLIGRYRYYSLSQDGETVRGILEYEHMREKRSAQPTPEDKQEPLNVRGVSNLYLPNQEEKKEDQENTAQVASRSEIERDIADGENVKREFLRKIPLVVARLPYPVERAMG